MKPDLERHVFSRALGAEFLDPDALQTQTGQPIDSFADVVVKELVDNALDAAESIGARPVVSIQHAESFSDRQRGFYIWVADNGPGMSSDLIDRLLDFGTLSSDKAAWRSPTRGQQGNAWKTVVGIVRALGLTAPVIIESLGLSHEIRVSLDPAGSIVVEHETDEIEQAPGTRVGVPLPADTDFEYLIGKWALSFALFNPHATFTSNDDEWKASVDGDWRKPLPTDRTSPHWYDEDAFKRLIFAHIANGIDMPLGQFVRTFAGLSSTQRAKVVTSAERLQGIEHLSDFKHRRGDVALLWA